MYCNEKYLITAYITLNYIKNIEYDIIHNLNQFKNQSHNRKNEHTIFEN
jgi:hypothetical protein